MYTYIGTKGQKRIFDELDKNFCSCKGTRSYVKNLKYNLEGWNRRILLMNI